jgi:tryptophan halogenase
MAPHLRRILIVGGGAAGWLAAAALARVLKRDFCQVCLIEAPQAADEALTLTVLPSFHRLNNLLGIDESDLLRRTGGTFSLGTRFVDWANPGERYFHTFGAIGAKLDAVPFHQYWLRLGPRNAGGIEDYCTASVAAREGRFAPPSLERAAFLSSYAYGYQFNAELFTAYLREYALSHAVERVAGRVVDVKLRGENGFVDGVQLDDGSLTTADLYIDCAGVEGVLFQRALGESYQDWSHWLPCDRAVDALLPTDATEAELVPYSEATACSDGWTWRTPLQRWVSHGQAYSSRFLADDEAAAHLSQRLPATTRAQLHRLRWSPGRPNKFWDRNCLSLSAGCGGPLESTNLHLAQTGIMRILTMFPVGLFSQEDIEEYNRITTMQHERIRDFLILHYKATARRESPFWDRCRQMAIPDTLQAKIELFESSGRFSMLEEEHFTQDSWLAVLLGQGVHARDYDPLADIPDTQQVRAALDRMRLLIREEVGGLPTLRQFINTDCATGSGARR